MVMPSSVRIGQLIDGHDSNRQFISVYVYRGYPAPELETVESQWAESRARLAATNRAAGSGPTEHAHWDWRNKAFSVEMGWHDLIAIEHKAEVQGIMAVAKEARRSQMTGQPIVYVDYLEAAPWNLRSPTLVPRFLGVGTLLIQEAIYLSLDWGLEGRLGLHSLPQAEPFYRNRCQMTELGIDAGYFDLMYFEFTAAQAMDWLAATGGMR